MIGRAAGLAAGLCLGATRGLAQDNNRGQNRDRGQGRGNFDPAQFRERMMEGYKETLEISDDTEWKAIQPLIQKVMDVRMAQFRGMGRGMMFGGRRGGPDGGGGGAGGNDRRPGLAANPDADALQRAVDSKASNTEMKAALAKYQEARKAKEAELQKAQDDLRKVLSVRQEAIATLNGLL